MSVQSRVNFVSQQRVDVPDFLAEESFTAFDFRSLVSAFSGANKTFVVRGLDVVAKNGLTAEVNVKNSLVFNPLDGNASFYTGLSDDPNIPIELPADQSNIFVEGVFVKETQAPVNKGLWDPLSNAGADSAGEEFSASIDSQSIVVLEVSVNTTGFTEGAIPLFRATTNTSTITNFVDSRNLLFRLGSGGANPDSLNRFNFSGNRQEAVANGSGVGNAVDSPWRSRDASGALNDKSIRSFKEWADAIMTRIVEISGFALWYQDTAGSGVGPNVSLQQLFFDTMGHSLQPSKNTTLKWGEATGDTSVLTGEGVIPLNPSTNQYHDGLVKWRANNSALEWTLGGVFVDNTPGGKRNYTSAGLRFASPTVLENGNLYLSLERDVQKGSGNEVNWGDAGTAPFADQESVSGAAGDFSGIALGDYIRKESGTINEYYKIKKFWNGTSSLDINVDTDENTIADSTIIALELESILDPGNTNISPAAERLRYFRSRYSENDLVTDSTSPEGNVYAYQDGDFYWLGRRGSGTEDGKLFYFRDYGTMQPGEEVSTLDMLNAHGSSTGSSGSDLVFKHAKEAVYNSSTGYDLKTGGPGELLRVFRRKRDNTTSDPGGADNSSGLLEYTLDAPFGTIPVGSQIWAKLSDENGGVLTAGSVSKNTTDDEENSNTVTNVYEILTPDLTPVKNFDNVDVYLLARRVEINGQPALLFVDGSILTEFGQMINTNLDISGEVRLNDYDDTAIPFIAEDGTKLLDQDAAEFFYNKLTKTFGLFNLRWNENNLSQDVPQDYNFLNNFGAHTLRIGTEDSTTYIPGDLIVDGDSLGAVTGNIIADDKIITLGVGNLLGAGGGSGIEVADDTQTANLYRNANISSPDIIIEYTSPHGYIVGDVIGVSATEDVGGVTAGQISGIYEIKSAISAPGDAIIINSQEIRINTGGNSTSGDNVTTAGALRTYTPEWSVYVGGSDGSATGTTSWVFDVKGVTEKPTITPVVNYGIIPTAHKSNMQADRIPFVNNDNSGPAGADTTLDFTSKFIWDSANDRLVIAGNIVPQQSSTFNLGEDSPALKWSKLFLGAGPGAGLRIGATDLFDDGLGRLSTSSPLVAINYLQTNSFLRFEETTSITGPANLPGGDDVNVFMRNGLVYSQDSAGDQLLLTNEPGNIYEENVEVVTTPTGNNQTSAISIGTLQFIPYDSRFLIANSATATTDGSSSTVTVNVIDHGLTTGDSIEVQASTSIGGLSDVALSDPISNVTVIDSDTFTYEANGTSTSVDTGFLDKITSLQVREYIVGSGEIEVYLNGTPQLRGVDYKENGTKGDGSSVIHWLKNIDVETPANIITFRIDSNGGQVVLTSGVSGVTNLQEAYDNNNVIDIADGVPLRLQHAAGSSGTNKLAVFDGDIEVTGIIDPVGVQLIKQVSDPFPSNQVGIYANTDGDLVLSKDDGTTELNITDIAGDTVRKVLSKHLNESAALLEKGTPVFLNSNGGVSTVDISNTNARKTLGICKTDIADNTSGEIVTHGRLEDVSVTAPVGDVVWVSPTGVLIGDSELTSDSPELGLDGYVAGDHVVRIGFVAKNRLDAAKKDVIVNVMHEKVL